MTSDLFAVWYSGLCSKFYLIHSSFSGNPADPQKAHIHLKPTAALQKLSKLNEKTQSVRFRIEKNGRKIELRSLKRVQTNCSLSVSDRTCTSDWSVQSETLSLLSRFLFVNPEKKLVRSTMPTDFFVFECIPIMAQHRKNCPKNLKQNYHRLDSLTELIVRKMRMAKLNRHNQSIPDSVMYPRSLIT